jgi:hypothetical protein
MSEFFLYSLNIINLNLNFYVSGEGLKECVIFSEILINFYLFVCTISARNVHVHMIRLVN